MRFLFSGILSFFLVFFSAAQQQSEQSSKQNGSPQQQRFVIQKQATIELGAITRDFQPALLLKEMPKQGSKKTEYYAYPEGKSGSMQEKTTSTSTVSPPIKGQSFLGNPFGVSTPNDNDMAISDSGMVISVINTNIYVKNIVSGQTFPTKSLAAFTTPINNKHQEFDPKVMYDPKTDRFVLVCLVGFVDTTSKIIVGFSQTNNPNGSWNLYSLPGNPLNNNLWSDYPMISMTEKELFLSINLLYNDSTWQAGFVETLVWQIKKEDGYSGIPLTSNLHSNIKFNGKAIRNLCPVKGGSKLYSPNMYFVSNRNLASYNDTVFLVNITDTIGAPGATVTVKAMTSNQPYLFPPDGRQPLASQALATNDCRNLGAFYENNTIQYVHNTKNPINNLVSVYYGIISNPQSATPGVAGYILANDTMDFAYPNISYAGTSNTDNTAIITFNHSSDKIYPGSSAIQTDGLGNFSTVLRIKNGATYVNLLTSNLERWGDYSGSQRKYNKPGEVWMSGYYGYAHSSSFPHAHGAWITQLTADTARVVDTTNYVGITTHKANAAISAMVYPNPAQDLFTIEFRLPAPEYLNFELYDASGKLVEILLRDWVKTDKNLFSFNTKQLPEGIYFLKITGNNATRIDKKIVIH